MTPAKYKFDPDSLSFDKIRLGLKAILLRFLAYFVGSLFIALIYWVIYAAFFDSPKEKALKREVEQMTIQYDLIHREMANVESVLEDLQKTDDNLYRTIFDAEPIPSAQREGGIGGVNRYEALEGYSNSNLAIETATRLDKIRKKIYIQSKSFDNLIRLAVNKEEMLKSIPAIIPTGKYFTNPSLFSPGFVQSIDIYSFGSLLDSSAATIKVCMARSTFPKASFRGLHASLLKVKASSFFSSFIMPAICINIS